MSDSSGFIHDPDGINEEKLSFIMDLKNRKRARIFEYAEKYKCDFYKDQRPWGIPCDLAFPCATQNEIDKTAAEILLKNNCMGIAEGANMPTRTDAVELIQKAKKLFAPGKASNAGGVAVSGLEMTQNRIRMNWSREKLERNLKEIIRKIHDQCLKHGQEKGYINYVKGANIGGFVKVSEAMLDYGLI